MGHEIVYCAECGRRLAEQEFARGQAHVLDSRPYCVQCRPAPVPEAPAAAPKGPVSERRLTPPSPRKLGSSARHAVVAEGPSASRTRMIAIGGAAGGMLLLVIVVAVLSSGGRERPPAPPAEPPPAARTPSGGTKPVRPAADPAVEIMKKLESVAAGGDPDAVLQAVDEARRVLKGTPQERRIDEIEQKALAARREKARERELENALAEAKRMEEADPEYLKGVEVEGMLGVALRRAGARAGEVQKRIDDYRARARAAAEKRGKGPFDLDGQGYVLNWLLLGPFPNEGDKGLDVDFLKGESAHEPREGLAVGKVRWGLHASTAPRIRFHEAPHLGVADGQKDLVCYAACKLMIDSDQDLLLRAGSDDGMALWLDGREIGRVHEHRAALPDQETYPVRLTRGLHRILVKVDQGDVHFEFLLRVTLPNGALPAGVRIWN